MEGLFSLTSCIMSPLIDDPNNKNSMKYLDFEKANILQKQFTSVFIEEPPGEVPTIGPTINNFTRSCLDSLDTN